MLRLLQKSDSGIAVGWDPKDYRKGSTEDNSFLLGVIAKVSFGNGAIYRAANSAVGQVGPGFDPLSLTVENLTR